MEVFLLLFLRKKEALPSLARRFRRSALRADAV
jgi:hypothetical protein